MKQLTCVECGEQFEASPVGRSRVCCSEACYRARSLASMRSHYQRNVERYRASAKQRRAQLKADAPEKVRSARRSLYWRDPEAALAAAKAWRSDNPDRARVNSANGNQRRRARIKGAPVVERVDRDAIYTRDGGRCHLCGELAERGRFDIDHLVPLSKGGTHEAANVAVSHPRCNRQRGPGRMPAQLLLFG